MLADMLEGRLVCDPADDDAARPRLFVDDEELTWQELGRLLTTFEGFTLQLKVLDDQ